MKLENKKPGVPVFVIAGLLVVIGIVVFIILQNKMSGSDDGTSQDTTGAVINTDSGTDAAGGQDNGQDGNGTVENDTPTSEDGVTNTDTDNGNTAIINDETELIETGDGQTYAVTPGDTSAGESEIIGLAPDSDSTSGNAQTDNSGTGAENVSDNGGNSGNSDSSDDSNGDNVYETERVPIN